MFERNRRRQALVVRVTITHKKKELERYEDTTGKTRAGIYIPENAIKNKTIEIVPGTQDCVHSTAYKGNCVCIRPKKIVLFLDRPIKIDAKKFFFSL